MYDDDVELRSRMVRNNAIDTAIDTASSHPSALPSPTASHPPLLTIHQVQAGCLKPLISICTSYTAEGEDSDECDQQQLLLLGVATAAIAKLSISPNSLDKMHVLENGVVPPLVAICIRASSMTALAATPVAVCRNVCKALGELAKEPVAVEYIR
jgi:hypothetical protein